LLKQFSIRHARPEDVPSVVTLERSVAEAPHWPEDEYRRVVSSGKGASVSRCLFVAEKEGFLLGFAVGSVIAAVGQAELESVAVLAEGRRSGVGTALCDAVVAWCREAGAMVVELEVRAGNAGARTLYGRMGFREVGMRPGYYQHPVEDAVLMRLGEGRAV
jgi:[ribosomal protein S18]-alanine N-acetyltransferase